MNILDMSNLSDIRRQDRPTEGRRQTVVLQDSPERASLAGKKVLERLEHAATMAAPRATKAQHTPYVKYPGDVGMAGEHR